MTSFAADLVLIVLCTLAGNDLIEDFRLDDNDHFENSIWACL